MIPRISAFAAVGLLSAGQVLAGYDPALVGTWSTKSKSVLTGPVSVARQACEHLDEHAQLTCSSQDFYNPVTDTLIEPALTGISYSFTIDGYYEEAYYRAVSSRKPQIHRDRL